MFRVVEVTTLFTVISVSTFEDSFLFLKYYKIFVLFIVCVVTLSSHNNKKCCFDFNREKNVCAIESEFD